jgi:hypothetical protein
MSIEDGISVTYNNLWASMYILNYLHECIRKCIGFERMRECKKLCVLGKSVNNHHDDTISFKIQYFRTLKKKNNKKKKEEKT